MKYIYKAYNSVGKITKGKIERNNVDEIKIYLQNKNLIPVEIYEDEGFSFKFNISSFSKKQKNLIYFFNQLYFYIKSGFTIDKSFELLQRSIKESDFNMIITYIYEDIKKGKSFSEALAANKNNYFNDFIISIIKSGELSGKLENSLKLIKDYLKNNYKVYNKITSSMIYPLFVVSVSLIILFVLMLFVIPSVSVMFEKADINLPLLTRLVLSASNFLINYFYFLLVFVILFVLFFIKYVKKSKLFFKFISYIKLKIPVYKNIYLTEILYKFSNSLGSLLSHGVDIITALKVGRDIINNYYYSKYLNNAITDFKGGEKLSSLMNKYDLFNSNFNETIKLGEESGQLSSILTDVSEYYKDELNDGLESFVSLIEPVLILILGLFVGTIIFSIMLPIFNISNILRQ